MKRDNDAVTKGWVYVVAIKFHLIVLSLIIQSSRQSVPVLINDKNHIDVAPNLIQISLWLKNIKGFN